MGTNFYIRGKRYTAGGHIGKRSAAGGHGYDEFLWAIPPGALDDIGKRPPSCATCHRHLEQPEKVIEDEYGFTYTMTEFRAVLAECPLQTTDLVGREFS